jgi:competence protein ComEC
MGGLGLLGSVWPAEPWFCALLAALGLSLLLVSQKVAGPAILGCLVFVVAALRAEGELVSYLVARDEAAEIVHGSARCEADILIVSSPTVKVDVSGESKIQSLWLASARSLTCDGQKLPGEWRLRLSAPGSAYARGDRLLAILQLGVTQYFQNEGSLDPRPRAARTRAVLSGNVEAVLEFHRAKGLPARIDRLREHVRSRIFVTFRREVVPLARALVLGENDLSEDEALAFSKSGLMHILAVSGTHLVLAVVSLERALFALLVRMEPISARLDVARYSGLFGAVLAFFYADFAGGSGSARRAAYMLAIVLGGRAFGYRARGSLALGGSICVGLILDPLVGFDISFLLSVLATLGLLFVAPVCSAWLLARWALPAWLLLPLQAMTMTLSSSVLCAPLLAFLGGQMTVAALAANLIAGPAGELLALPCCLLHALASPWPALERGLAVVGGGALYVVRAAALSSAGLEALAFQLPAPSARGTALLLATVLGLIAARSTSGKGRAYVAALTAIFVVLAWRGGFGSEAFGQPKSLVVTALDVGQGDSLFVEFPGGQKALIDGGGYPQDLPDVGRRVVVPFLRGRVANKLDLLVLSHADRDHLLGLLDVAREVQVKEFWYPGIPDDSRDLERLLDLLRKQGTRVIAAKALCGTVHDYGAKVEVLAPCGEALDLDRNNASLVVRVSLGRRSALLTGDIELPGEEVLVATEGARLRSDFLKVAHHGSRTSTTEAFFSQVRPEVAFISLGIRNTFGHPSAEVLERLREGGVSVARTDKLGALSWATDGDRMWVSNFADRSWRPVGEGAARRVEVH